MKQDGMDVGKIKPEKPWPKPPPPPNLVFKGSKEPPPPGRRATDHEGETLFGDEERSRLRAVHSANLYRRERRLGFWLGLGVGCALGASFLGGAIWLAEVLR